MSGEKTSIVMTEPSSGGIADSPPAYYVTGTNSEVSLASSAVASVIC